MIERIKAFKYTKLVDNKIGKNEAKRLRLTTFAIAKQEEQ